jgi:hypothetical protein
VPQSRQHGVLAGQANEQIGFRMFGELFGNLPVD